MLTKEKLIDALKALGKKLENEEKKGEILIAGGAAMSLILNARTSTQDIDALYEPKDDINRLANIVAREMNLPKNWLNDGVKGFMSEHTTSQAYSKFGGLSVNSVTPECLLAMKLFSARIGDTDVGDVKFLMEYLNITTVEGAHEILDSYYPANRILPKTAYFIEEIVEEINSNTG